MDNAGRPSSMSNDKMINTWKKAADELNITVISPLALNDVVLDLLVAAFGSKKGTVILPLDWNVDTNLLTQNGYYFTFMNPASYSEYNEQLFIDTLNDWGFFGDTINKPKWYTGQPWTE